MATDYNSGHVAEQYRKVKRSPGVRGSKRTHS